jgi:hypothetical protein
MSSPEQLHIRRQTYSGTSQSKLEARILPEADMQLILVNSWLQARSSSDQHQSVTDYGSCIGFLFRHNRNLQRARVF